jgi:uncharacterized protein
MGRNPIATAALIQTTLLSAPILFFALGALAALARSDLSIPDQIAKGLSIYLMVAIGFKGGQEVATSGLGPTLAIAAGLGVALSFLIPFWTVPVLRRFGRLDGVNAAAVAAHYGSISIVTFVTALELFKAQDVMVSGAIVAVVALMETPAIVAALLIARQFRTPSSHSDRGDVVREVMFNSSVVLLMGAFAIGALSGEKGYATMAPLIGTPFRAVLCFFLLDMGLVAMRRLLETRALTWRLAICAIVLPIAHGLLGVALASLCGLSVGDSAIMGVLTASASYIAAPAAIRLTLPEANPGIYLTLSLGITFPFNVIIGLPLFLATAHVLAGG